MNKILSVKEAVEKIKDGDVVCVGGFYAVGTPNNIINEMVRQGKKDLTVVTNDGGNTLHDVGVAPLIDNGHLKKIIMSWCGYSPIIPELVSKGLLDLELNPQGTLIERIRAGGFGLEGILTRTGLGTIIEEKGYGKRVTFNGNDCLYHTPIKADVTIVEAYEADKNGNLIFRRTQRNFCEMMCYSGKIVIASVVKPIKALGALDPDAIMVPGTVVDILVQREEA